MDEGHRYGGTSRLGTLLVGRSDELHDLVLKYEVVERHPHHYVLCRQGHRATVFHGRVENFALLATVIFQRREQFHRSSRLSGAEGHEAWKRERERLMSEWDAFPVS